MREETNEYCDLDRTVVGADGTTYRLVAQVGYGTGGWAIFWGKGKRTRDPIVTVYVGDEQVHQEPAADRHDAERTMRRLEDQLRSGSL